MRIINQTEQKSRYIRSKFRFWSWRVPGSKSWSGSGTSFGPLQATVANSQSRTISGPQVGSK